MTNPIIEYYDNGNKFSEHYIVNGQFHRDPLDGPAVIIYYNEGKIVIEKYYVNGKLHRGPSIGPAVIGYYVNGKNHNPYEIAHVDRIVNYLGWWFNDKEYTSEVENYLNENNLDYKTMTQLDFDVMWMNIL